MSSMTFFFIFVCILALLFLVVNFIFALHKAYQEKYSIFECGFHSFSGQSREQFDVNFFKVGVLFLTFDIEVFLAYPFAVSQNMNDIYGLIVAVIFLVIVTIGFVFELGKSALKIDSRQTSTILNVKSSNVTEVVGKSNSIPLQSNISVFSITCIFMSIAICYLLAICSKAHRFLILGLDYDSYLILILLIAFNILVYLLKDSALFGLKVKLNPSSLSNHNLFSSLKEKFGLIRLINITLSSILFYILLSTSYGQELLNSYPYMLFFILACLPLLAIVEEFSLFLSIIVPIFSGINCTLFKWGAKGSLGSPFKLNNFILQSGSSIGRWLLGVVGVSTSDASSRPSTPLNVRDVEVGEGAQSPAISSELQTDIAKGYKTYSPIVLSQGYVDNGRLKDPHNIRLKVKTLNAIEVEREQNIKGYVRKHYT